jgi:hypothetical protein
VAAAIKLGDEALRRDDPVALFDPVAKEIETDALGAQRDRHPARAAEAV